MSEPLRAALQEIVNRAAPEPPPVDDIARLGRRALLMRRGAFGALGAVLAAALFFVAVQVGTPRSAPSAPPGGEGGSDPSSSVNVNHDDERGFEVTYPSGWDRGGEGVTRMLDPRELFILSTIPIEPGGACAPEETLARMGPTDALIMVTERVEDPQRDLPDLPEPLALDDLRVEDADCWSRHILGRQFRAGERHIIVQVLIGPEATTERREEVRDILASLEIDSR